MIFPKLYAGMVALVAASSLLLSPPASADPLELPAPKAGPAATAVAETASPVTLRGTCEGGGRLSLRVSPTDRPGYVRVVVTTTGLVEDSVWRGEIYSADVDGDPHDDEPFRKLRAIDGGWRVAADLGARWTDTVSVQASTGRRLGCVAVLNRQAPTYGLSFCRSGALGVFIVRRVPDTQRYTIQFRVGQVRPSSRWEMRVGKRTDSANSAVVTGVRASKTGLVRTNVRFKLSGDTVLSFLATGPGGQTCRLAMRRTW